MISARLLGRMNMHDWRPKHIRDLDFQLGMLARGAVADLRGIANRIERGPQCKIFSRLGFPACHFRLWTELHDPTIEAAVIPADISVIGECLTGGDERQREKHQSEDRTGAGRPKGYIHDLQFQNSRMTWMTVEIMGDLRNAQKSHIITDRYLQKNFMPELQIPCVCLVKRIILLSRCNSPRVSVLL